MKARSMLGRGLLLALASALAACGGRPQAPAQDLSKLDLAGPFGKAVEAEQLRPAPEALEAFLALLDRAVAAPSAPHALEAVLASADAVVGRSVDGLDRVFPDHALAFRTPGGTKTAQARLASAWEAAGAAGPFARSTIARAALGIALHEGDVEGASRWRSRVGCAREATVAGPLEWAPITAVLHATPLEEPTGKLAASYPGVGPFAASVVPTRVPADVCAIRLDPTSILEGVRAVVVDVDVPRPQRIGVVLHSSAAAIVVVGGKVAVTRGYELGGSQVARLGTADVPAGRIRVVARVAQNGEAWHTQLDLLADDGTPLVTHAPAPGEAGTAAAVRAGDVVLAADRSTEQERALVAAAYLANDDGRPAEHLIEETARASTASPLTSLVYARAIDEADDLPEIRAIERAREAYERALKTWPSAWEAIIGHAQLTGRRRGAAEGRIETLREIAGVRASQPALDPIVRAYEADVASDARLLDEAEKAFTEVKGPLAGTAIEAELDDSLHDRTGAEREAFECATPGLDRSGLDCEEAKSSRGDHRGALAEIERVRALRGSPTALRPNELSHRLAMGDDAGALAVWEAMFPAERTVSTLGVLLAKSPGDLRAKLLSALLSARDVPGSLGPLYRAMLEDPAEALEAEGQRLVTADRQKRAMADAATAVLLHREAFTIGDFGLLHYTLYDLRRVSGTTDVEQGAQAVGAMIEGRDTRRTLRRRIYKPDGRVLEPDRASFASQGHADLSQLEKGDYIEQIAEGWTLPGASGQLVVDTADLLPERTSIREATIEIRRPRSLELSLWSHAMLGKADERVDGAQKVTTFTVKDRAPRRIEEGVAKMDQEVSVSFGTSSWKVVGRSIAEAVASLDDRDPYVSRWAREAAGPEAKGGAAVAPTRELVERIVAASGKSVKVASGAVLSDSAASLSGGAQGVTARTILELGQGSRTWLVYRALRELSVPAEIVVAEREPFSADPAYPAHFGRFDQPLVVAHLPSGDLWLDVDVSGPPLPAGRVSPELRGRTAMGADGVMRPVGGISKDELGDEVDIRLKLDAKGDAIGTFTALLRGRPAQSLADALEKVVGTDRRDMLRGVVLGWLPWANVNDVTLSSDEGSWQISLRADIAIPGYAQPEGATWVLPGLEPLHAVFPRAAVSTLGATFASQGARQSALAVDTAFQYHAHRRVELPAGAKIVAAPPGLEVKDEHVEAARKGGFVAGVIDEDFALSLPTGTVDAATYGDFAGKVHRIDDAFMSATRVSK